MNAEEFEIRVMPLQRELRRAVRLLGNTEATKDTVQDVMTQAWHMRKRLAAMDHMEGYVAEMLHDHRRRSWRYFAGRPAKAPGGINPRPSGRNRPHSMHRKSTPNVNESTPNVSSIYTQCKFWRKGRAPYFRKQPLRPTRVATRKRGAGRPVRPANLVLSRDGLTGLPVRSISRRTMPYRPIPHADNPCSPHL